MVATRPVRLKGLRPTNTYFPGPLSDASCWAGPFTGQQHLHKGNPPLMALVCSRLCKAPWHRQALQTALPPPASGPPLTSLRVFCFLTFKKIVVLEGWNDAKECSANYPRPLRWKSRTGARSHGEAGTWLRIPGPGVAPSPKPDSWVELLKNVVCDFRPAASASLEALLQIPKLNPHLNKSSRWIACVLIV